MTISFHGGHSGDYCDHAGGKLKDVVENAIAQGFSHYGLSEHMPRAHFKDLYPEERQRQRTPAQLAHRFALYIHEARQLQHKYRSQIHLLVGMETEFIADEIPQIQQLCQTHAIDYLVGSVHHVAGIPFDYSREEYEKMEDFLGGTEAAYCAYYDAQLTLMQQLHPPVIGHFDLIRIHRPHFPLSQKIWQKIERNLAYAISYGALFDMNARAFRKNLTEPYPQSDILKMLLALGGKVTLGDDSHHPEEVGLNFNPLLDFLRHHNLTSAYALEKDQHGKLVQKRVALPQEWPRSSVSEKTFTPEGAA